MSYRQGPYDSYYDFKNAYKDVPEDEEFLDSIDWENPPCMCNTCECFAKRTKQCMAEECIKEMCRECEYFATCAGIEYMSKDQCEKKRGWQ